MSAGPIGDLAGLGAAALLDLLTAGSVSSVELVHALLERIDRVDHAPDGVRSVLELNPEAMADARSLDDERAAGVLRGALHGVPVLIKDNIDTAGPLHTTAGSWALRDTRPYADAPLVRRLRDAGAVVLGKANLSEWANYRSTGSTSGWSAVGGLTRNPWDAARSAGGSSSGSAAAVAAGLAPLSVGSETDGSIICPAAFCGVVGFKPTVGLVPTAGVVPIAASQDSVGPMARTVHDAALLLAALTGTRPAAYLPTGGTSPDALRGIRIGVPRAQLWTDLAAVAELVEVALETLVAAGAALVEVTIPGLDLLKPDDELTVLDHELKAGLAAYLATRPPGGPRTLADLIAFNRDHSDVELLHFDQDIFERAERTTGLDSAVYREARQRCLAASRDRGLDAVLAEHSLDALVMPSGDPAWLIDLAHGDGGAPADCDGPAAVDATDGRTDAGQGPGAGQTTPEDAASVGSSTLPALAGYPIVTVPCGLVDGLPVGVALTGTAGSDAALLRIAGTYELRSFGPAGSTAALGPPVWAATLAERG